VKFFDPEIEVLDPKRVKNFKQGGTFRSAEAPFPTVVTCLKKHAAILLGRSFASRHLKI